MTTVAAPTSLPTDANAAARATYATASLYVGGLHPDTNETTLVETFSHFGAVLSVRVCRDSTTHRSLLYGYVNFQNYQDAERALQLMNHKEIKGKPCRIMWSQRDPTVRKSGVGNIVVKNLAPSVTNEKLYDKFSVYGNILSAKVSTNAKGESNGYGFVQFEAPEAADKALSTANNSEFEGKTITVESFKSPQERQKGTVFTNVFAKNLPEEWTSADFEKFFAQFGTITSAVLAQDEEKGVSKCFGFVNYATAEEAVSAIEKANGQTVGASNKQIFVGRAQTKEERQRELHERAEASRQEFQQKNAGTNLYVKNLADDVDEDKFRTFFSKFGNIVSARVVSENGRSKGFGFVSFTTPEEATKALTEGNGAVLQGKPLYVSPHQPKEQRVHMLEAQFANRSKVMNPMYGVVPNAMGFRGMFPAQQMRGWGAMPPQAMGMPMMMNPNYMGPMGARVPGVRGQRGGRQGNQGPRGQYPNQPRQGRVPNGPRMQQQRGPAMPQQPPALDTNVLATLPESEAKQLLGDRIFPLVAELNPNDAAKLTGMLLEMEIPEIIGLLESQAELISKVEEAYQVLEAARAAEEAQQQ